jgi:hypothetical protein
VKAMTNYVKTLVSLPAIKAVIKLGFVVIFLSFFTPGSGQSNVYLQHRYKPNVQRKISPKRVYNINTSDSTFYSYHILALSDSTLKVNSESRQDLRDIPVGDIEQLEKVKNYGVFEVVGTLGIIGLTITPIIWATEGNDEALGMLEASGVLLASSVPIILLKDIGRKKDMRKKWKLING